MDLKSVEINIFVLFRGTNGVFESSVCDLFIYIFISVVGQNVPPGMAHPKRSQTTTAENSAKEEGGVQLRKPGTQGSRGAPPASPLLGNANNPNKADIPDRRKGATTGPAVSVWSVFS